ncbi:SLATT domain-containing protein [Streptomyces sp. NBC_00122]|uniref:SLATT domain-containing protein n=1 Tax=Streptomyces sp. NBC_00122 TaxID=2903623 RepID=UPI002F90F0F3
MVRDFDDDAPRRIGDANELVLARQRDADERIYVVTTNLVIDAQEKLARRKRLDRIWRAGAAVSWLSLLTAVIGTGIAALTAGDPARFVLGDLICGSLLLMSLLALVGVHFAGRDLPTLQRLEAQLASAQESLWKQKVKSNPDLDDRRKLYREEVTTAVEQYQADSRKYRRIHNGLQTLIMIGSASTTTIAALDTGKELTWQSVTLTVSFAITVAAMFTGYYKFRERSYFLQQTADAIEEEANAVRLGIGAYSEYGRGQEGEALKLFTQRVEQHRNEQRRRQQQLDQPADQAVSSSQPPA